MANDQDSVALPHRLLTLGAVGLLASAGALAFGRVYRGHVPTLKLVAAALLSVGVAGLLERRGPILAVIGSAAGLFVAAAILVFPKTAATIFPTSDTVRAIARALHHVGRQVEVQVAPTRPLRPLLLAGVTAVWTAAFAAHSLAVRAGSPLLAALPPASLLSFADVLLDDGARPSYAALFLAAALAVLFMDGLRRVKQWGPLRPWPGFRGKRRILSTTATRGARRLAAVTLGVAVLVPGALPGFQDPPLLRIATGTLLSRPTVDPLVSVTASLKQRRPQELFLIRARQPAYWRWLALDNFNGVQWSADDLAVQRGQVIPSGAGLPQSSSSRPASGVRTATLDQTIEILQPSGADPWLPMAFRPTSVDVGKSSIRYDPATSAAVPEVGIQQGLTYTVHSQLSLPTPGQLDRVRDLSTRAAQADEQLPADTPPQIYDIARRVTRGQTTPFRKILAIQTFLHENFQYDQQVSGAHDIGSLVNFLTHTRRGFCQQFATAMAVLVRALGYPARVAVGFTPGHYDSRLQAYRVGTQDAHAWVEVLFPGYGWLAFEPTPTRDNPVADSYLVPGQSRIEPCRRLGTCGVGAKGSAPGSIPRAGKGLVGRGARELGDEPTTGRTGPLGSPHGRLPMLALSLLLALALFLLLTPAAKAAGRRARVARAGDPRSTVLAAYRSFTADASDLGLGRAKGETLREYRDHLRGRVPFSDGHLDRLTDIAGLAAYGPDDLTPHQAGEAVAAARLSIREMRRATPPGRRVVGLFRPRI